MNNLVSQARAHAIEMHDRCQHKRSNGEPYWRHPERVVATLVGLGVSPEVQAAGWLHDVPEDCAATMAECEALFGEIERRFGSTVAGLVREVTNFFDHKVSMEVKHERLVEHARHMSPYAKRIKLADRRDNITDMDGWTLEKKRRYAEATLRLLVALEPFPSGTESVAAEISQRAEAVLNSD